jgi:hypothetical protein
VAYLAVTPPGPVGGLAVFDVTVRLARWHDHGTRLALTGLDHPVVVVVLELFPGELLPGHPDSTAI